MAKTNFSGPITTGPIQVNTGTTVGTNVRDAAWVLNKMAFPIDYANFVVTTDDDRIATAADNGTGTTTISFVSDAVKANVSGITSDGGFEMASVITQHSAGNDSGASWTITGTDVLGNTQTETLTAAGAGATVTSAKTYKTLVSMVLSTGSAGAVKVGVIETGLISMACRSLFNEYPLAQTSSTTDKNLANNIVIPAFSRITDIRFIVNTAFDTAGFDMQIGANVAQASGSLTNSLDTDYFAGDTDNDVKGVASHHIPTGMDQTTAQMKNCLNVSDDDASGYEMDKAVVITCKTDDTLTAGDGVLSIEWLQRVNDTN